jgi:hypothetical protein
VVQDYTKNIGTVDAQESTTQYFFSLDPDKNNTDVLLGSRNVSGLAQGVSSGGAATVTVPVNLTIGSYFIVACANSTQTVIESNETNNCHASGALITVK